MKKLLLVALVGTFSGCSESDSAPYCEYGSSAYNRLLDSGHTYNVIGGKRVHDPRQCWECISQRRKRR